MRVREPMVTDKQWAKIEPLIPKANRNPKGGRLGADDRLMFEAILWVLKTGARRKDLPGMPIPQLAGGCSSNGMRGMCSRRYGEPSSQTWITRGLSIGTRCSWMADSFLPKRWRRSRKDQPGKGSEVPGTGRWPRYSSRKPYRLCLAG